MFGRELLADDQGGKALHLPIELRSSNGLVPKIFMEKTGNGWSVNFDFEAQTNFARNTWLRITNRVGSRLRLWTTNRIEIVSTNTDLLHVTSLPAKTTVREIMSGVPRRWRVNQWLYTQVGGSITTTGFNLQDYFSFPATNDVVLQITPLMPNGDVKKIEVTEEVAPVRRTTESSQ
jgi:hypothetical protein